MFAIQNILTALLFIIFYFQLVDTQRTMSKEDVLKIKNEYYVSFYCKNDICFETDFMYEDETFNDECSSKKCDYYCALQRLGPPYFEGTINYVINLFIILFPFILLFAFAMGLTICCCRPFTSLSEK
ncbi:hypothetical protein U3516DRAFT_801116 [Neocallimastix sp. 'constans']